jgi:hypothetical protein
LFRPEMQAGLMNFQYLNQPIMDSGIVVEWIFGRLKYRWKQLLLRKFRKPG